jgi:hypothetical protein
VKPGYRHHPDNHADKIQHCKAQGGHADGATGRRNNDPEYDPRRLSLFSELQQKASDRSFKDVVPIRRLVATYFDVTAANRLCCSL